MCSSDLKIYANVNPWDFLGIDERRQASRFFNTCQYKASFEVLKGLCEKAQQRKPLYRRLAMLVEGYYQWDLFRHRQAIACFKNTQLEELADDREKSVRQFAQATLKLQELLEVILKNSQQGTTPCAELVHDLYANAMRRIDEGKTDDAILRLYRLVEMLAQARLLGAHGINVSDIKPEQLPESIRAEYVRRFSTDDGKIKIGQHAAYILLNAVGDPLGHTYVAQEKQFKAIQQARNGSYLAYGFASSKEDICMRLKEFVLCLGAVRPDETPVFPALEL